MDVIKIKYHNGVEEIKEFKNGDWIDLRASEDVRMSKGDFKIIPLGVSMELPKGYEAIVAPRSSTFKNYGILMANGIGIIDESYNGDNDVWGFPALCMVEETYIPKNERICQFRLIKHQNPVSFNVVKSLGNENRGGFGSTGVK